MSTRFRRVFAALARIQTAWSIVGITLVLILALEAALRAGLALKDGLAARQSTRALDQQLAEAQGDPVWPIVHARELEQLEDRWAPWVLFRQRPYLGLTINIDEQGVRKTWNQIQAATPNPNPHPRKILFLGGSTLWGFGARDEHTIPSHVARLLADRGLRVIVKNLAEIGYVSTQELIALTLELEQGERPDVVVFLDGVNDTTSALLEGKAGVSTNESNRRADFNLSRSEPRLAATLASRLLQDSGLSRIARSLRQRIAPDLASTRLDVPRPAAVELVPEIVRVYAENVEFIRALGLAYGFEPVFCWQPVVFTKQTLTAFERAQAAKYQALAQTFRAVRDTVQSTRALGARPDFHDLSARLDDHTETCFIDYCHTTEKAGEQLAAAMLGPILEALARPHSQPTPVRTLAIP